MITHSHGDDNDPIRTLMQTYHELNPSIVDELCSEPGPVDFLRYVAKNRPFVVRGGAKGWKAVQCWNADYLREVMGGHTVNVAVTPKGNADGVVQDDHGRLMLVEPHETLEGFAEFIDFVQADAKSTAAERSKRNVKYAQTQNDNLRDEYSSLFADVPSDISFATLALEQDPEAVNFWLGSERSITALHKDNYENIYVQVIGQKHFVLLPPIEMPCVNETPVPFARYQPIESNSQCLEPKLKPDSDLIPVPLWDPDEPDLRASEYSQYSQPLRVTLDEGDMMYLPAMWYHKVKQSSGREGFSCSVNYWYDMDFSGSFWAQNALLRDLVNLKNRQVAYPALEQGEEAEDTEVSQPR